MGKTRIGWIGIAWVFGLLGLGSLWVVDRAHRWESPRLEPALFTVLRDLPAPGPVPGFALVAVNLGCPHCMRSLRQQQAEVAASRTRQQLVVLLVDQEHAPSRAVIESLEAGRIWWDRRGIWRHRWGHRIYGEVLRFDAAGRYLGTTPPRFDTPS